MKHIINTFLFLLAMPLVVLSQNALHFDGVDDRVSCGNASSVQITGNQITLEAWIKPSNFGTEYWRNNIINKEVWVPEAGFMLRCGAGGKLNFTLGNGSWHELVSSSAVLTANTWQHVAGTYDGSYMRIYVNGMIVDSMSAPFGNISHANTNLTLGDYAGGGRYYSGAMDEVRIWNVARSQQQLQATMNTEICSGVSGLVASYSFNQGQANANNSNVVTLFDESVNANHGYLSNFALNGTSSNWVPGATLSAAPGAVQDTITKTICSGGSYLFAGQVLSVAGSYQDSLISPLGCDSIITLNLQVNTVDTSVSWINSFTLQANAQNATFQWIDCDAQFAPIQGAVGAVFSPFVNGNYAVVVSQDSCVDTSACHAITGLHIKQIEVQEAFQIYPNPFDHSLHINSLSSEPYMLKLSDASGRIVLTSQGNRQELSLDLSSFARGVYVLHLIQSGKIYREKLIKIN